VPLTLPPLLPISARYLLMALLPMYYNHKRLLIFCNLGFTS
jgi:hypothetical protein